jgi:carbonyl reductase 1
MTPLMALSSLASSNKRVLVTGANKGIGKAICQLLLEKHPDVHVILGARNEERGQQAVEDLKEAVPGCGDRLEMVQLDTTCDESVQRAADAVGEQSLYGIINNAGIGFDYSVEEVVNVNYFGTRRVNDVFGKLVQRPGGRIVNIASAGGPNFVNSCTHDEDLQAKLGKPLAIKSVKDLDKLARSSMGSVSSDKGYGYSKALLNAYTVLHAHEEEASSSPDGCIIVNSCTPGYIVTDLTEGRGATNPPSKGAVPPVHLLLSKIFDTLPPGRYYGSDCIRSPLHVYRGPGDPPYEGEESE